MRLPKNVASIALIVCALGLAAYVVLVDKDHVSDTERAARPKNVFPAFRRDEMSRVEITTDKEKLVFERALADDAGDRDWTMTSPRAEKVEPDAVDRLMGALEFATFVRKVDANSPGMQPVRAHGSITMGKLVLEFSLGQPAPSPEGASYFSVRGEGSWVVSKELVTELLKGSDGYRSRSIVPYLSVDLSQLDVQSATQHWTIDRRDETSFVFADTKLRASRERLDRVWLAFADMRADSFLESVDDARPAYTIRMVHKDPSKPPGEIAVLGPCPTTLDDVIVVRRSPSRVIACVPKVVLDGLSIKRETLVDDRLFSTRPDEVEELSIETVPAKTRVELARKANGWHLRSPVDRDLSTDEVDVTNGLVSAIAHGVGAEVASAKGCTVTSRVTLVRTESHAAETIEVGPCENKRVAAVRVFDGARLFLASDLARKLVPRVTALEGPNVLSTPIDTRDVVSLSLRCGTDQDLSHPGPTWLLDAPRGFSPDQAGAVDLLDAVIHARVDAWVADEDDPSFGLSNSPCKVTVGVHTGAGTRNVTLSLGREGEGGVYGRAEDNRSGTVVRTPVFVASRALRETLARILIDRSALGLDASRAESIRITAADNTLALEQSGSILALLDGGSPPHLAEVERALAALRADQVVHLGPALADEQFAKPSLVISARVSSDGGTRDVRITFGRATLRANENMFFARIDGVDATFAVASDRLTPLIDALR